MLDVAEEGSDLPLLVVHTAGGAEGGVSRRCRREPLVGVEVLAAIGELALEDGLEEEAGPASSPPPKGVGVVGGDPPPVPVQGPFFHPLPQYASPFPQKLN